MSRAGGGTWAWPEALIGFGLLIFAALVLWSTTQIPVSPLYSKIGPTHIPLHHRRRVLRSSPFCCSCRPRAAAGSRTKRRTSPIDWRALAFVAAGLLVNVALIVPLGFIAGVDRHVRADRLRVRRAATSLRRRRDRIRDGGRRLFRLCERFLGVNIGAGCFERLLGLGGA